MCYRPPHSVRLQSTGRAFGWFCEGDEKNDKQTGEERERRDLLIAELGRRGKAVRRVWPQACFELFLRQDGSRRAGSTRHSFSLREEHLVQATAMIHTRHARSLGCRSLLWSSARSFLWPCSLRKRTPFRNHAHHEKRHTHHHHLGLCGLSPSLSVAAHSAEKGPLWFFLVCVVWVVSVDQAREQTKEEWGRISWSVGSC